MRKRVFVVFAVLLVLVIALSAGLYLTSGKNAADSSSTGASDVNIPKI